MIYSQNYKKGTFFNTKYDPFAPQPVDADISIILDKSQSMYGLKQATIDGYNEFLDEQATQAGKANVSLYQFSTDYEVTYKALPIDRVPKLNEQNYRPQGMTALNDAIGRTIDDVGKRLFEMTDYQRPKKIIVLIMTDGGENSSREYSTPQVANMIKHQQEVYNWEFLFIGANQDALATGSLYNIPVTHSINYMSTEKGTRGTYGVVGMSVNAIRSDSFQGFTDADRSTAMGENSGLESISAEGHKLSKSSK